MFRQLISLLEQLVAELTRQVGNQHVFDSNVRFQDAFVLASDAASRAHLRVIFVGHQVAIHELDFLSANLAGLPEIALVHESHVLHNARLRAKNFVAVFARKAGAVFFEGPLLLVDLSVSVKAGSRLR